MKYNSNRVAMKLRSKKGASITFALLLFLICAIISSVVLVAGTTAAGRLSGMAGSEQRYYAVTSTAKYIQEVMESESATVIEMNGDIYLVTQGNKLVKMGDVVPANDLKSLADYVTYMLYSPNGSDGLSLSADAADLNSAMDGITVDVTISDPGGGSGSDTSDKNVTFTVKSENQEKTEKYTFGLEFTTNAKEIPVEVGAAGGSTEGGSTEGGSTEGGSTESGSAEGGSTEDDSSEADTNAAKKIIYTWNLMKAG